MVSFTDGTDRSSIRTPYAIPAEAAGEWARLESVGAQCHPVCGRAWWQGAGSTGPVRAVAHPSPPGGSAERRTGTLTGGSNTSGKEPVVRIKPQAVARASPSGQVHPDGTRGDKTRATGQRKSCGGWSTKRRGGGRKGANGRVVPGIGPGCAPRSHVAPSPVGGQREKRPVFAGPGGCRHRDLPAGLPLGIRPEAGQAVPRSRATVPATDGVHRVFSRFEKLAVLFLGLIVFALICEALR